MMEAQDRGIMSVITSLYIQYQNNSHNHLNIKT